MKGLGINFVYTHNYGCEPGTHLGFAEMLQAADDMGMLVRSLAAAFRPVRLAGARCRGENGYARARGVLRPRGRKPSVGGDVLHEPQRHRLRRGQQPGHDRRHPGPAARLVRNSAKWPCVPRRSSNGSIPAASSTITPRATWARSTRSTSTPTSPPSRKWTTGSALGDHRRKAVVHLRVRRAVHLGLGDVPRLVPRPSRVRQRRRFPGSTAWPNGTPSSTAIGPSRSARSRRRTCAGRPAVPRAEAAGIAGTIPSSRRPGVRRAVPGDRPCTPPTTGGRFAPGGSRPTVPGSIATTGSAPRHATATATNFPVDWKNLQRPGFSPDYSERPVQDAGRRPTQLSDWSPNAARQGNAPQQHAPPGLHRRQDRRLHQQGPQLHAGRNRREAAHRHQQLTRDGDGRLPVVNLACQSRAGQQRVADTRRATSKRIPVSTCSPPQSNPARLVADVQRSHSARRNAGRTPSHST